MAFRTAGFPTTAPGYNPPMARSAPALGGWPLVGWAAAVLAPMCALILALVGTGEEGLRMVIRATARTSLALFLLAFTASSARHFWQAPTTAWLLRNRRYLGVSFAVSHTVHLAAIVALATEVPGFGADPFTTIFGSLAYLVILAMTATSFDRSAAWLGRPHWKRLHTAGSYYLWLVFFVSFAPAAVQAAHPTGILAALALIAALGLRVGAGRARLEAPAT